MLKIAAAALVALIALSACGGEGFSAPLFDDGADAQLQQGDAAPDSVQSDASPEAQPDAATAETSETGPEPDAQPEADAAPEQDSADEAATPEAGPDGCIPGTCESLGKDCGPTPDGCGNTIVCGSCPSNQTCGGGGVANVCGGCVPDTCAAHGFKCGTIDDGCGNTIVCGPAPTNKGANANCEAMGLSELWQCGGAATAEPEFAPPFSGCKPYYYYYCCPE